MVVYRKIYLIPVHCVKIAEQLSVSYINAHYGFFFKILLYHSFTQKLHSRCYFISTHDLRALTQFLQHSAKAVRATQRIAIGICVRQNQKVIIAFEYLCRIFYVCYH